MQKRIAVSASTFLLFASAGLAAAGSPANAEPFPYPSACAEFVADHHGCLQYETPAEVQARIARGRQELAEKQVGLPSGTDLGTRVIQPTRR